MWSHQVISSCHPSCLRCATMAIINPHFLREAPSFFPQGYTQRSDGVNVGFCSVWMRLNAFSITRLGRRTVDSVSHVSQAI